MQDIDALVQFFIRFPGVGKRQAQRFAYHVLALPEHDVHAFIEQLKTAAGSIRQCSQCYRYFSGGSDAPLCDICRDPLTEDETILVVEKDIDVDNVRRSGVFKGRFFVLGGLIPLSTKQELDKIRMKELFEEVKRSIKDNTLKEIIIGLSINPEGEHTTSYILSKLDPLLNAGSISVSLLGRGLSTGAELEYMDRDTLTNAFNTRTTKSE